MNQQNAACANAVSPKGPAAVCVSMAQLEQSVESLAATAAELVKRLAPVLHVSVPADNIGEVAWPESCPLVTDLDTLARRVRRVTDELMTANQRLELP